MPPAPNFEHAAFTSEMSTKSVKTKSGKKVNWASKVRKFKPQLNKLTEAKRQQLLRQALADINGAAKIVEHAALQREFPHGGAIGLLEHAVDDAAGTAAPEDHRIRALERLDALDVVEVAKILHVVADAVDIKIGARALAADDHLVAIEFALMGNDAGGVAQHLG